MPKIVDHDQRRLELIEATWQIISEEGLAGATMRRIAARAGYANGILKHYFPNQGAIIQGAFERVTRATAQRSDLSLPGLHGLAALRQYCLELMPVDDETIAEARVAVAFTAEALKSPQIAAAHTELLSWYRNRILFFVVEARSAGEITSELSDEDITDALCWMMSGLQSSVFLTPVISSPERQLAVLDALINSYR